METLVSLVFLLLLPCPSWLYSVRNCLINSDDQTSIRCLGDDLSRIPSDIPKYVVDLAVAGNIQKIQQDDFHGLAGLQMLNLNSNEISLIEDAAFLHLSALTNLEMDNNMLRNLTDGMFKGLSNLTFLTLRYNEITSIAPLAFVSLRKLQKLDLSNNILHSISDIVNAVSFCPSLESLDLLFNPLTSFESEHFSSPLNITDLNLGFTYLRRFTLHSNVLPNLQSLRLSSIDTELQWNVSDKAFLKRLKFLDLSLTRFRIETYQIILQSVDSLEELDLSEVGNCNQCLLSWACGIQTLHKLHFMSNHMSAKTESLLPCSNLTELDISLNPMLDLSESSLQKLTHLSRLFVASNHLRRVPLAIKNMSSLTFLTLQSNNIDKLHCSDFSNLRRLTFLDLSTNKLTELNGCVFQHLQNLHTLCIDQNFILSFDDSFGTSLPNLQIMRAFNNNILTLQNGVFRNMSHLRDFQFQSDRGTFVEEGAFDGLTDLKILCYSPTLINDERSSSGEEPQSSLEGGSELNHVFNLPSLDTLSLTVPEDMCFRWPQDYLKGLVNLTELTLERCFCWTPDPETFRHTPRLLSLEIKKNELWSPVPELFQPLGDLQTLELSENKLKSLNFLSEANLTQLQTLLLWRNDLSVINVSVFETLPSLRYLSLNINPFACDCSNEDFIFWAQVNKQVYVENLFNYMCASPPSYQDTPLLEFDVRRCWESVGFPCFICSFSLVLLTLLSTFLHHFFRLHLLYCFYLFRAFLYHRQKRKQDCAQIYDAFVSYNTHDEEWVYRELVPELEERQGWKLCLHHRDFIPGKFILENITDAIYSSRKTLCVISQHYLHSEWCSREIQMASYRLFAEQKDVLILLFLEELEPNQLNPFFRMRKLLRNRTYLSWDGARGHRGLFWERVRRALESGAQMNDNPLLIDA